MKRFRRWQPGCIEILHMTTHLCEADDGDALLVQSTFFSLTGFLSASVISPILYFFISSRACSNDLRLQTLHFRLFRLVPEALLHHLDANKATFYKKTDHPVYYLLCIVMYYYMKNNRYNKWQLCLP
jgi:hypothetical protein